MSQKPSKAFDKCVSEAPNVFLLSTDLFHFSNIARRHWWVLKPFRNPHCICSNIFLIFFVQGDNICMFKNFRKCREFYGIGKSITEKITKNIAVKLSLGCQSFVMLYLHLALESLFQFVSDQPQ